MRPNTVTVARRMDVVMGLRRDRRSILTILRQHNKPVLWSQILLQAGEMDQFALMTLVRDGLVEAVFPEAKRGDSGRQFWQLTHHGGGEPR